MADRVTFTKGSADRIAKAVRIVEAGNRDASGSASSPRLANNDRYPVRFCSWTANWSHGATAAIQFTPFFGTATANNVFLGVGPGNGWVVRKGTAAWQLVGCDLTEQPGYSGGQIQLFGHDASAVASWYSITTCSTATA